MDKISFLGSILKVEYTYSLNKKKYTREAII